MIKIEGKNGISVTVVADSIHNGIRMTTFEAVYPRFIHSEVMTHRMLSKNAASSRAIPVKTMCDTIRKLPATPVFWGENQPGMSAVKELDEPALTRAKQIWTASMEDALSRVEKLSSTSVNLHKQISNRISEPWQMMKTVISGTEWANLLWLRNHHAAQPEFHELAACIDKAFIASTPRQISLGQWHMPYVEQKQDSTSQEFFDVDGNSLSVDDALIISVSACAQVSYRKNDLSLEKAKDLAQKLQAGNRTHASPFEHQAKPIEEQYVEFAGDWDEGITHFDRYGDYWSGNLRGWVQHRQLIPDHSVRLLLSKR